MKFIRTVAAAMTLCFLVTGPRASGIPVVDVAHMAQTILMVVGQAKELMQIMEQVKTAKSQLTEAKNTLASISGGRGMAALANMTGMRQVLPEGFMEAATAISKLGAAGASKDARAIYDVVKRYGCDQRFIATDQQTVELRKLCEAEAYSAPNTIAMVEQSVKRSQARAASLQQMLGSVDTKDAKAAMDLQNRIQLESAMLANEKMMMDLALRNQEAQQKLIAQQIKEEGLKRLSTYKSFDPFKD